VHTVSPVLLENAAHKKAKAPEFSDAFVMRFTDRFQTQTRAQWEYHR